MSPKDSKRSNINVSSDQLDSLRVKAGDKVHPNNAETNVHWDLDEKATKRATKELYSEILGLQERLYAEKKQSVLIVLQAMDAAGKDSTIRKLTSHMNVQGARVQSFGKPTKLELSHDFLWRIHDKMPAKGEMVIFNRSHYEDVLIVKVHGWCSDEILERRYEHINHMEALAADSGTKVIKLMLNISPEYQLTRFKSRLYNPGKNWKFNPGDLDERKHWEDYMAAFADVFQRCSTEAAPWYVIPAEQRWLRDYIVARLVRDSLVAMNPQYPEPDYDATAFTSDSIS